jgi:hypothetical protein
VQVVIGPKRERLPSPMALQPNGNNSSSSAAALSEWARYVSKCIRYSGEPGTPPRQDGLPVGSPMLEEDLFLHLPRHHLFPRIALPDVIASEPRLFWAKHYPDPLAPKYYEWRIGSIPSHRGRNQKQHEDRRRQRHAARDRANN